jgi:hypothetical protein
MRYAVKADMPTFDFNLGVDGYKPSKMVLEAPTVGTDDLFHLFDPDSGDEGGATVSMHLSELEGLFVAAVRALAAHHGSTYRTVLDRALDTLVREDSGK